MYQWTTLERVWNFRSFVPFIVTQIAIDPAYISQMIE